MKTIENMGFLTAPHAMGRSVPVKTLAKSENVNEINGFAHNSYGTALKTFLTAQRTGAISRLADLGLVTRAKEGLRVTYHLAPSANNFRREIL